MSTPSSSDNQTTPPCGVHPNLTYYDYYGYLGFCGPLCVVGFFTNILCVIVLSRDRSKVSTTFLLQVLAMADNGLLAAMFFFKVLNTAANYNPCDAGFHNLSQIYLSMFAVSAGLTEIFKMFAVLMVVVVTVDRCIAMFFPLRAMRLCTIKTAAWQCLGVAIYVIAFNMPRFFEFKVHFENGKVIGITQPEWAKSDGLYQKVYYSVDSLINLILPVLLVFCLNVCLILRLKKARASRREMTSSQQNGQSGVTVNLVGVASVFLLCEAPIAITTFLLVQGAFQDTNSKVLAHTISDCFQVFNSFINFFIYYLVGQKFRKILSEEVCCIRYPRRFRSSSWSRATATTTTSSKYMKEPVIPLAVITR